MPVKRRFSKQDFRNIADYVVEEYQRRKGRRKHFDKVIKEIDRQVEMRPDVRHKMDRSGNRDPRLAWMPEVELPLQAEALETLMADTDEMLFPSSGPWYSAHAELTDDYLERVDFQGLVAGDRNEVPSQITQDNADKLVGGIGNHWRRQYDFRGNISLVNAEALSYGMGVARGRITRKAVFMDTAKGIVRRDRDIPVLVPKSIKNTYLDDRQHILMQEGFMVGPLEIFTKRMILDDLKEMAKKGSNDPKDENGGWMPRMLQGVEADKDGIVEILEAEGDIVIPRSRDQIFVPNVVVWVVHGKNDRATFRLNFRKLPYSSVIRFPYQRIRMDRPEGSSPLMKGWPLQAAATEALMRTSEASALNTMPPIGYDRNDLWFAERGGPVIAPGRQWGTIGEIVVHKIGDPVAMMNLYAVHSQKYADTTGVHRARLGAQTVSHTTAFAKNAELQRGAARTVNYVKSTLRGPLTLYLQMEYELGKQSMKGRFPFYLDAYKSWVEIEKSHLADNVLFEAHGSAGPIQEAEKTQARMTALQTALQMDNMLLQTGRQPNMDIRSMQEQALLEGGWPDIDPFFDQQQTPAVPEQPGPAGLSLVGGGGPI